MNDSRNAAGTGIVLQAEKLVKCYEEGNNELEVLSGVDLTVTQGDILAIIGTSGSGKSTLLNLLGGLDRATRGTVSIAGNALATMSDRDTGKLRNRYLGFVYQFHHLLPEFTALENVAMPLLIRGESPASCKERAAATLKKVGLDHRLTHKPSTLSGGERQRVAIATALTQQPAIWLADEPTNHLDLHHQVAVMELLHRQAEEGAAVFMCLHDLNLAARWCDHLLLLYPDGELCFGPAETMLVPAALERLYDQKLSVGNINGAPVFVPG